MRARGIVRWFCAWDGAGYTLAPGIRRGGFCRTRSSGYAFCLLVDLPPDPALARCSGTGGPAGANGTAAFVLLMISEVGVSVLSFGRTLAEHLEAMFAMAALPKFLGQLLFAVFPVLQLGLPRS